MNKILNIFVLGLILCISLTNSQYSKANNNNQDSGLDDVFGENVGQLLQDDFDKFDWQYFSKFNSYKTENILVSPLSLKIILSILYEAAGGQTQTEIKQVLGTNYNESTNTAKIIALMDYLKTPASMEYVLDIANRMFLDGDIQPESKFSSILEGEYNAKLVKIDVTKPKVTAEEANNWVKEVTRGNIQSIVSEDDLYNAVIVLANTMFFNGTWEYQFNANDTKNTNFYVSASKLVNISMMSQTEKFYFLDSPNLEAKLLKLPFKGEKLSMILLLPNSIMGLRDIISRITVGTLKRELSKMTLELVDVSIPKFSFEFESHLVPILKSMGLREVFENTANLAKIARGKSLKTKLAVNDVIQKVGIDLNEIGSTIYAATAITLVNKFGEGDDEPQEFLANRPFMFFVQNEETKQILFIGTMDDPRKNKGTIIEAPLPPVPAQTPVPIPAASVVGSPPAPFVGAASINQNYDNLFNPQISGRPSVNNPPATTFDPLNIFDTELLKYVGKSTSGNFMISPASIKAALGLILEGARGTCADELRRSMKLPNDQEQIRKYFRDFMASLNTKSDGITIESANRIFLSHIYNPDRNYADILRTNYYSEIQPVSFPNPDTISHINRIINASTHGLIPEMLEPGSISPDTIMILTNALYFKGLWDNPFYSKLTKSKCFRVDNGCHEVAMMEAQADYNYAYIDLLQSHAIEIPYKGGKYSMVILLPNDVNGISTLLRDISYLTLPEILKKMSETEVELSMPRFTVDYSQDLISILQQMGIQEVFNSNADLFGLVERKAASPHINSVIHKTRIEVTEEGSTAAAATGSMVVPLIGTIGITLNIDHPFLFFIRDVNTGTTLFQGRVTHPDIFKPTNQYQQPQPSSINRQPSPSRIPKPVINSQPLLPQSNDRLKPTTQRAQTERLRPKETPNSQQERVYYEGQQVMQQPTNAGNRYVPQSAAPVYNFAPTQNGKQSSSSSFNNAPIAPSSFNNAPIAQSSFKNVPVVQFSNPSIVPSTYNNAVKQSSSSVSYNAPIATTSYNNAPVAQPSYSNAPVAQPTYNNALVAQPTYNNAPVAQPTYNNAPVAQSKYNNVPIAQPTYNNVPVAQSAYNIPPVAQSSYSNIPKVQSSLSSSNTISNDYQSNSPSNSLFVSPSLLQSSLSSVGSNAFYSSSNDQNLNFIRDQGINVNDFGSQRKRQDSIDNVRTYTMQTVPNHMDKLHATILNNKDKDAITFQQ